MNTIEKLINTLNSDDNTEVHFFDNNKRTQYFISDTGLALAINWNVYDGKGNNITVMYHSKENEYGTSQMKDIAELAKELYEGCGCNELTNINADTFCDVCDTYSM